MPAIAAVGLLTIALSLLMIASPARWSAGIVAFAGKPYFHIAEILSRLVIGGVLVVYSRHTLHPLPIEGLGALLIAVGLGLTLVGPRRHRAFALKSAGFTRVFRPAGCASLAFGLYLVYGAWVAA